MKIEILNTDQDHPINSYLWKFKSDFEQSHSIEIVRNAKELSDGDVLFLISCNEKISAQVLGKFVYSMVLHASDLPLGRGWSPHIWELIGGNSHITVTLLDAANKVDSGDIYAKKSIEIPKSALWNEINELLFGAEIKLMEFVIENYKNLKKMPQNPAIEPTYYRKRTPLDGKIDASKSICEQFDLIRVCDPNRFPAFFELNGSTYKLTLEKK